jgi:hypothetical protein
VDDIQAHTPGKPGEFRIAQREQAGQQPATGQRGHAETVCDQRAGTASGKEHELEMLVQLRQGTSQLDGVPPDARQRTVEAIGEQADTRSMPHYASDLLCNLKAILSARRTKARAAKTTIAGSMGIAKRVQP